MHRSEARDIQRCWGCGAEVSEGADRVFTFGPDGILCFACASERGGVYDERHDHWDEAPNVGGLARPEW